MKLYLYVLVGVFLCNCTESRERAELTTEERQTEPIQARPVIETLVVRSGTMFLECYGYCQQTLELTGAKMIFTKLSDSKQDSTLICKRTMTAGEWASVKAKADITRLSRQPPLLGSPASTDAAEFLEIGQGGKSYRVTFEHGQTIPGFEKLVTILREKRRTFNNCQ